MGRDIARDPRVAILVPSPADFRILFVNGQIEIRNSLRKSNRSMHPTDPRANDNDLNQLSNPKTERDVRGTCIGRAKSTLLFAFHGFSPFQSVSPMLMFVKEIGVGK
jgi:hypothetical protein